MVRIDGSGYREQNAVINRGGDGDVYSSESQQKKESSRSTQLFDL